MRTLASFSDFSRLHAADITCHAAWNGTLRCENLGTKAENPYVTVTCTGKCRQLASVCCRYVYVNQTWLTITVVLSLQLAYLPFILLLKSNLRATRTFQVSFLVLSDASYMKLVEELPGTLYALFCLVWFVYTCALKWKQLTKCSLLEIGLYVTNLN